MKYILGTKKGMTQIFDDNGRVVPVTLIQSGPLTVTQVLTKEKNGYDAIQLGFGQKKLNKPEYGHLKDFVDEKGKGFAVLREFQVEEGSDVKKGDTLNVSQFQVGEKVTVRGTTKGKGFQGVVKRWGFAGGPATHGQKHTLRTPGSIGSAFPQRVLKGIKMAGHMGDRNKSILNLKIAYIDEKNSVIGVKGAVPGNKGGYVEIVGN